MVCPYILLDYKFLISVFGKAILCLAKVGEDIYFEGEASGVRLLLSVSLQFNFYKFY